VGLGHIIHLNACFGGGPHGSHITIVPTYSSLFTNSSTFLTWETKKIELDVMEPNKNPFVVHISDEALKINQLGFQKSRVVK
jgi:hypothetical protein